MPLVLDTKSVTKAIITGKVNRVIMLLSAVRVTDKATSPLASIENTFDELPPGQQATNVRPMKYMGGRFSAHAMPNAINGNRTICPAIPAKIARGFFVTPSKAFLSRSVPSRNISTNRIGITIQTVFIFYLAIIFGCPGSLLLHKLPLVVVSMGSSLVAMRGPLVVVASLVAEHGL